MTPRSFHSIFCCFLFFFWDLNLMRMIVSFHGIIFKYLFLLNLWCYQFVGFEVSQRDRGLNCNSVIYLVTKNKLLNSWALVSSSANWNNIISIIELWTDFKKACNKAQATVYLVNVHCNQFCQAGLEGAPMPIPMKGDIWQWHCTLNLLCLAQPLCQLLFI
jgi:hypothetical protein